MSQRSAGGRASGAGGRSGGGGAAAASPSVAVASPRRARAAPAAPEVVVLDLTLDSDDDGPSGAPAAGGGGAAPAARAPAPQPPRRAAAAARESQDDCVIVAEVVPPEAARRAAAKAAVLDLTKDDDALAGLLPSGAPVDGAALALLQRLQETERELAEARRLAARAAGGVEAPAHWKLQAQELNLCIRELPLPAAFAAGPALPSAKREAVRAAEAAEAARVLQRFGETPSGLSAAAVTRVWRVQNRRLWGRYADRRAEVADGAHLSTPPLHPSEQAHPSPSMALLHAAGERLLFHGADAGTISAIVAGGFECRIASMGGALGAGAYFAEHASYSNNYSRMPPHAAGPSGAPRAPPPPPAWLRGVPAHLHAQMLQRAGLAHEAPPAGSVADAEALRAIAPAPGRLLMIVARVALGRTGAASAQMRIAPPGFHSVGDNPRGQCQIYAVFDNYQAYPEYVLEYEPTQIHASRAAAAGAAGAGPMMPPGIMGAAAGSAAMAMAAMNAAIALAAAQRPAKKSRRR